MVEYIDRVSFEGHMSNDITDTGLMYDQALDQLVALTEATRLNAKAVIAAGLIVRGMYNPAETGGLTEVVNRILEELKG